MSVFLVIQIISVVCLIIVILLQHSSSDGFTGGGGSSTGGLMTGRGKANLLTKATSILATIFIINSLILAYMSSNSEKGKSIADQIVQQKSEKVDGAQEVDDVAVPIDAGDNNIDVIDLSVPLEDN